MNSGGAFFLCFISFPPYDILVPITVMSPRAASKSRQEGNEILRFFPSENIWNGKTNHHRILGGIQKIFVLEVFAIWLFIQTIIIVRCRCEGWCERALEDVDGVQFCCPRVHIYPQQWIKVKAHTCRPLARRLIIVLQSALEETTLLFKYIIKFLCNSLLSIVCFLFLYSLFLPSSKSFIHFNLDVWTFQFGKGEKWPSDILAVTSESSRGVKFNEKMFSYD